jgi:hypothetical protein
MEKENRSYKNVLDGKHDEVIAMYQSGKTMAEIGEKFGLTRQRICQVLQKNNVKVDSSRRGRRPVPQETIDTYVAEAVRLNSKQDAAAKLGVSVDAITRALRRSGIRLRGKDKFTNEETKQDIKRRYLAGERLRVIAESYGTRAQHINTLLRKWGVQPQGWHRGEGAKGSLKIHQG